MSKPTDLRRRGTILVLGVIAGYGVRYVASRVSRSAADRPTGLIDWEQARTFALRVSQWEQAAIPDRTARREQYTRLVERSEPLIAEYLGVQLPEPINRVYVVDRREWLEANFSSFSVVFSPVEDLYQRLGARQSGIGAAIGQVNGRIIGAQMGIRGLFNEGYRLALSQHFGGGKLALNEDPPARAHVTHFDDFEARICSRLHCLSAVCSVVKRHAELQDTLGCHLPALL